MTDDQIKHMVERFLGWRLPENFAPDGGISFKATFNDDQPFGPMKHKPSGTNLFDSTQAAEMVRYMIRGMPTEAASDPATLTIEVDTSKLTASTDALNRLAEAAERAAKALDGLGDGRTVTIDTVGALSRTMVSN
jgi:hypothetical protein